MKSQMKQRLNKTVITFVNPQDCKRIPSVALLYSYQNARCFYCDAYMQYISHCKKVPQGFTVDHVFPNSLGYTKSGNIALACRDCNEKKGNDMPSQAHIRKAIKLYNLMGYSFIVRLRLR